MGHLLRYRLLRMIRNRVNLFWTLGFPLILMTLFSLILSSAYRFDSFKTIPLAVVESEQWNADTLLQETMEDVAYNDIKLFSIQVVDQQAAEQLLQQDEVVAIVQVDDTTHVQVKVNGIKQSIVQSFFTTYQQQRAMILELISSSSQRQDISALFSETHSFIDTQSEDNTDLTTVSFYTCLAMSVLNSATLILRSLYELQANQSTQAARVCVSPTDKRKILWSDLLVTLSLQMVILAIQFIYLRYVLDASFGDSFVHVIMILIAASLAGNGLGIMLGVLLTRFAADAKVSIVMGISVLCCFLTGMMSITVKWLVDTYVPLLAIINPANMVTDGLYALYYYGVGERYYVNFFSLLIFAAICYTVGYLTLRKKQYASLEVR